MNNIVTIMKKELKRFFGDKRMLLSLILPGLLIFIVYSLMGTFMGDIMSSSKDEYTIYSVNSSYEYLYPDMNINTIKYDGDIEEAKQKLIDEEIDLLIIYPLNYENDVINGNKPNIEIYYFSKSTASQMMYEIVRSDLVNKSIIDYAYTINNDQNIHDLTTTSDITTMLVGMLVPFLLVIFLATGCMAVATESFAGEKERGTIATLLVTPIKRSHLALGKISALTITALLSATSSLIGLLLSLPKLMNTQSMGLDEEIIDISIYKIDIILPIIGIVLTTVMLFIVLISIVSVYAKSVKEATSYTSPIMILITVLGAVSMSGVVDNTLLALIPVYNSINSLSMIFSNQINILFIFLTIIVNIGYISLGIFVLTKMFENEKVIFNK